jgi:hypothetical protein
MAKKRSVVKNSQDVVTINGYTWLEYFTSLYGYDNFQKDGHRVYKYQLFWKGVNPNVVIKCQNGYSCQKKNYK